MSRVLVALDVAELDDAKSLVDVLAGDVGGFKVGLELLSGHGPRAVEEIAAVGLPVFADAKLHDIPNTVAGAARRLASSGARWITVHAAGGQAMMGAAVKAAGGEGDRCGILAVTVLTSMADSELRAVGIRDPFIEQVERLATLAAGSGVEGVVCSPGEVRVVRDAWPSLTIVTPGIRLPGQDAHDQKRVGDPATAVAEGADYLVIGRPITEADDPVAVARSIAKSLDRFD